MISPEAQQVISVALVSSALSDRNKVPRQDEQLVTLITLLTWFKQAEQRRRAN